MGNIDAHNANHGTLSTSACPKQTLHMSGPSLGVEWCSCQRDPLSTFLLSFQCSFWRKSVVLSTISDFDMVFCPPTWSMDLPNRFLRTGSCKVTRLWHQWLFGWFSSNDLDVTTSWTIGRKSWTSSSPQSTCKHMQADSAVYGDFLNSKTFKIAALLAFIPLAHGISWWAHDVFQAHQKSSKKHVSRLPESGTGEGRGRLSLKAMSEWSIGSNSGSNEKKSCVCWLKKQVTPSASKIPESVATQWSLRICLKWI